MGGIKLNQALRRTEISGMEIENELVFAYFDAQPADEREAKFKRALQIGVLALQQDRLSAFLARTESELGTELEALKIRFDLNAQLYAKSTVKGTIGETQIAEYLERFLSEKGLKDSVELTGNAAGTIDRNKTGDIICNLHTDDDRRIVIECKFDKGVRLGSLSERDWHGKNTDTALSQLIEAKANRDAREAIIVFDKSSINPALLSSVGDIAYLPSFGFIVVVDSLRADFRNLGVAFLIARSMATANRSTDCDNDLLLLIIERILADVKQATDIKSLVQQNMANSRSILEKLEQTLLAVEFSKSYLSRLLETGTLSKTDLLEFYSGTTVKEKFKAIEATILEMGK